MAARATRRARGARRRAGGVRAARGARLGMSPTRGAHLPERGREGERRGRGEGVTGWAGKGDFLFFTLVIYLFSEIYVCIIYNYYFICDYVKYLLFYMLNTYYFICDYVV